MPPVSIHGVPLAAGREAARPEPAHSIIPCIVTVLKFFARSNAVKVSSLSTRPLMVSTCLLMSITGVVRLLRTNMRSVGVTSKSCSCAGTLPVSGRSECHCIDFTFSPLTMSLETVPGGSVWAMAFFNGSAASALAPAATVMNSRRDLSFIGISASDFAAEHSIGIESVADDERQNDAGADQHEHQRARVRGRVPDRETVDHHVGKEAVGEPDESQHENCNSAGEGLPV